MTLKPNEILIEDRFIARHGPGDFFEVGDEVGGTVRGCHFYSVGSYTPHLFRRPRLARFAPLAQSLSFARAAFRWSRDA
jgi:hypothetical protein